MNPAGVDETIRLFYGLTDNDGFAVVRNEIHDGIRTIVGYSRSPRRIADAVVELTTLAQPGVRYEAHTKGYAEALLERV